MREIHYKETELTPELMHTIRLAREHIVGEPVQFVPWGDFDFRWGHIKGNRAGYRILGARMREYLGMELPRVPEKTLFLDIETHSAQKMWDMTRSEFVRLVQWGWGWDEPVRISTDIEDLLAEIWKADLLVAHFGHQFDFSVLLGGTALDWGMNHKLFDPFVHGSLAVPSPDTYKNREGRYVANASSPGQAQKWLSLDNLSYQFGTEGKVADLKELAKAHNPPKTLVKDLDFGLIPVDDPTFLEYAEQDIHALRDVTRMLLWAYPMNAYAHREQQYAAINAQISRNGWRVDQPLAESRVQKLAARKGVVLEELKRYGLPGKGKQPWRTKEGKAAILAILESRGITPETHPEWPLTATGNLSLGGEAIMGLVEGTDLEDFGREIAEVMGQRSLAELALDSVHNDGKVHPTITTLQRSGRSSLQRPGLTVWSARADGGVDKEYFIPNNLGEVLIEADLSNADARAVAAYSGDTEFAKRFEVDEEGNDLHDGHNLSGEALFGTEEYWSHRTEDGGPLLRDLAKMAGHAQNYRVGATTLSNGLNNLCKKLGIDRTFEISDAWELINNFGRAFPGLRNWQERVTAEGEATGWVTNAWGRSMPITEGRAFTQSSALYGQSATREIMVDGLLKLYKLAPWMVRSVTATIHDALVVSVPREKAQEATRLMKESFEMTFNPPGGQPILFTLGVGKPAQNWKEAGH